MAKLTPDAAKLLLARCRTDDPAESLMRRALESWLEDPSTKKELYVWSCLLALPAGRIADLRSAIGGSGGSS